ncbi:MAG: alpha/beta hydrolase [Pseudonocardiaceae bacterium]
MGDWNNLKRWDAAAVQAVADDLNAELKKLQGTAAELRDAATPKQWDGEGAQAAADSLKGIEQGVHNRVAEHAALRTAADDAASRLKHLQTAVEDVEEQAKANRFVIEDGKVIAHPMATAEPGRGHPDTYTEVKEALQLQVDEIVRATVDIDVDLTNVMLSIADGNIIDQGAATMAQAVKTGNALGQSTAIEPPKNATAVQNEAWWDTLSRAERDHLIKTKPELIGNRKGIPYSARSEANLNRIPAERERLEAEADQMREWVRKNGHAPLELQEQLAEVQSKLDALDALLGQADAGRSILSLDTAGPGVRAAVAIGNVDAAEHVGVYVPGLYSKVEGNMGGYVDELEETTGYAEDMLKGTGEDVASVVWMDYHAPQDWGEVLSDDQAEAGAKRLAAELDGIQASRADNPPDRLTAIGHSYGSTTAGLALKQTDSADAFVSQGSPGWGEGGLGDMKVPQRELYDMASYWDVVAGSGAHGDDPDWYDINHLSVEEARHPETGELMVESSGHTDYTDADDKKSTAEHNTAAVIVGRGDLLIKD